MNSRRTCSRENVNEIEALAEAVLDAADTAGLGVTVCFRADDVARLVYANDSAGRIFGRSSAELLGMSILELYPPDKRAGIVEAFNKPGEGFDPQTLDTEVRRQDGECVPVELGISVVPLSGEPAVVCFMRDTTERRLLQAELAARDRMATLGTLAAGVAHEINNPLGYLKLNVETLIRQLERCAPAEVQQGLGPVIAATRDGLTRVATIVRDMQCLSAPQLTERWPVDPGEILDSAVNLAMHAIRGRVSVEKNYEKVCPLRTDPTRVGQILLNLVSNAVQSFEVSNAASNVIRLSIAEAGPADVAITIMDNGPGIAKDHLDRIFDPFFTTKATGAGLGLAISRSLARSLGGTLQIASAPGLGTRAVLSLPAASPAARAASHRVGSVTR